MSGLSTEIYGSNVKCCVKRCRATKDYQNGITLHRFPTHKETRKKWEDVISIENFHKLRKITGHTFVCSQHFLPSQMSGTSLKYRRLTSRAVPSIFPPLNKTERKPKDWLNEILLSNDINVLKNALLFSNRNNFELDNEQLCLSNELSSIVIPHPDDVLPQIIENDFYNTTDHTYSLNSNQSFLLAAQTNNNESWQSYEELDESNVENGDDDEYDKETNEITNFVENSFELNHIKTEPIDDFVGEVDLNNKQCNSFIKHEEEFENDNIVPPLNLPLSCYPVLSINSSNEYLRNSASTNLCDSSVDNSPYPINLISIKNNLNISNPTIADGVSTSSSSSPPLPSITKNTLRLTQTSNNSTIVNNSKTPQAATIVHQQSSTKKFINNKQTQQIKRLIKTNSILRFKNKQLQKEFVIENNKNSVEKEMLKHRVNYNENMIKLYKCRLESLQKCNQRLINKLRKK